MNLYKIQYVWGANSKDELVYDPANEQMDQSVNPMYNLLIIFDKARELYTTSAIIFYDSTFPSSWFDLLLHGIQLVFPAP